jgi:hypothetical protein
VVLGEQVSDGFVVNFEVGATNEELLFLVLGIVKISENMVEGIGYDALRLFVVPQSDHGVSLTTACLPVGEDSSIVSLHDRLDQGEGSFIVD